MVFRIPTATVAVAVAKTMAVAVAVAVAVANAEIPRCANALLDAKLPKF
jgi:hypothetical protein